MLHKDFYLKLMLYFNLNYIYIYISHLADTFIPSK